MFVIFYVKVQQILNSDGVTNTLWDPDIKKGGSGSGKKVQIRNTASQTLENSGYIAYHSCRDLNLKVEIVIQSNFSLSRGFFYTKRKYETRDSYVYQALVYCSLVIPLKPIYESNRL